MGGGASSAKGPEADVKNFEKLKKNIENDKQKGLNNEQIFDKHAQNGERRNSGASNQTVPASSKTQQKYSSSDDKQGSVDFNDGRGGHERRQQIFSKGIDVKKGTASIEKDNSALKAQHRDLLRGYLVAALRTFFFMDDAVGDRVEAVLDTMRCERVPPGDHLMRQGEAGDKMYIVQTGKLEVVIDGKRVRELSAGDSVGELSLLYNAPRSASVRATAPCTVWSIRRDTFREVQALASSATLVQRVAWLRSLPALAPMDAMDVCKLAGAFATQILRDGEVLFTEGVPTDRCYLIESGAVAVTSERTAAKTELARLAGGVQCVVRGNVVVGKTPKKKKGEPETADKPRRASRGGASPLPAAAVSPQRSGVGGEGDADKCLYLEGAFLGTGVVLAAAGAAAGGAEPPPEGAWPLDTPDESELPANESVKSLAQLFWGAVPPVTVRARGEARASYFTVQGFEAMLGTVRQLLDRGASPLARQNSDVPVDAATGAELRLSTGHFEDVRFLGTGSFGRVTMVVFKKQKGEADRREIDGHREFALKGLKKQAISERGQLAHVKDERRLLLILRHPFILRLFCTFQDDESVYLLTESLTGGELWSVIYEGLSGHPVDGVAAAHARFYSAIVIEALGYMHTKGVAYRDLKPENIMVDAAGYLRLIDLGFAKKIPFAVELPSGEIQVHPKSYTMCGTPEYLAPEFIFNTGHDHSADYWAFGVLAFELVAGHTPFAPPGAEADMTHLFTSIACVKRDGVRFPADFDDKARGGRLRDLVEKLLRPEPSQRLGNLAAKTEDIKQHPYFEEIDWRKLYRKELPGVWVPPRAAPPSESNADPGPTSMPYTGNPADFAEF